MGSVKVELVFNKSETFGSYRGHGDGGSEKIRYEGGKSGDAPSGDAGNNDFIINCSGKFCLD